MDATEATALRHLLRQQPVAALATLHRGEPAVSMVPFALLPQGRGVVLHVSRLATHTADLLAQPAVGLLVMGPPGSAQTPLALPRASIRGRAQACPTDAAGYAEARAEYLAKLPDSEELFSFADFSLFVVEVLSLRYVAGFGRAMSLLPEQFRDLMAG